MLFARGKQENKLIINNKGRENPTSQLPRFLQLTSVLQDKEKRLLIPQTDRNLTNIKANLKQLSLRVYSGLIGYWYLLILFPRMK